MSSRRYWFPRVRKGASSWGWGLLVLLLATGPAGAASASRQRSPHPAPRSAGEPVNLTATAGVLMDAKTGQVLYDRNAYLAWPPASTTKIMTALVAIERTSLDAVITISPAVAHFREGSVVGLPANARIPLRDLLYALLLPSGNDVALAIAEGTAGSVPAFVTLMNEKAWQLGATQTHFTSPHGLYDPEHSSTAYDLALIARVAMENPIFREIVHTRSWVLSVPGKSPRRLFNHNRFLNRYPGADGVKTGYVHQSGQMLVASATHERWRLIAVVLHSRDLYGDASRLLNYGFAHYHPALLASAGEPLLTEKVSGANGPVIGTVSHAVYGIVGVGDVIRRRIILDGHLTLPVRHGARIGEVAFYVSGRLLRTVPLVAASDVHRHTELAYFMSWVSGLVVRIQPSPTF